MKDIRAYLEKLRCDAAECARWSLALLCGPHESESPATGMPG
jgi:hypothetical protein